MLYHVLWRQAESRPENIAVAGERRSVSYAQLFREVRSCAAFLQQLNFKPQDPIILGVPPSPEFHVVFYAGCAVGATVIPVLSSGKISPQLPRVKPRLAVGDRSFLNTVEKECRSLYGTLVWDRKNGLHLPDSERGFKRRGLVREERVIAVSSSGSTGTPALYYWTAGAALERAKLRQELLAISTEDVLLSSRPYNSGSSITNHVILPVVAGCKIVIQEKFQRLAAAEAIEKERITVLYAVPFIFEMLASIPVSFRVDFSSLRLCISGGAPLSRYVYDRFLQRFGLRIRQRYGGTHIHPASSYNLSDVPEAVGQLAGPFPMAVLSDDGEELGAGKIGEIVFDFSKITRRWKKHLKDSPSRRGKYIYTGDLGKADDEGNVYIVGRKSKFIKVAVNRVEFAEVENIIRSHPQVREAVVFPLRLGKSDEAVGAVVVRSGRLKPGELLKYCATHLDGYKCPRQILFRKSLPRNLHGKVARFLFEQRGDALKSLETRELAE